LNLRRNLKDFKEESNMLVLNVKPGQYVKIGQDIKVCVSSGKFGHLCLSIDAPKDVEILRDKVIERIQFEQLLEEENLEKSKTGKTGKAGKKGGAV